MVMAAPRLRSTLPPLDGDTRKGVLRELQLVRAHITAIAMYVTEGLKRIDALNAELVSSESVPVLSIGQSLKMRRLALGLRQDQVAAEACLSRGQVSDLESGRRRSAESLAAVLAALLRLEAQAKEAESKWRC